jgi:UDP-N-acetyl-D-galactosamine dehydrogenase
MLTLKEIRIGIIGLGYVGLPLAIEFGKKRPVTGFDVSNKRLKELRSGIDVTNETTAEEIVSAKYLSFSNNSDDLKECDVYIITVPTPVDTNKAPDLSMIISASKTVGAVLNKGNIVIYESTVYPGATEEEFVPVLEEISKLKFNKDFYCGYSPERINPGDKEHTLTKIMKVTSGSTVESANIIDELYCEIIEAGTHKADNIKVAEAAKVIENTQRDLNIALMNELSIIFKKMDIDTSSVLEAAGTKWNFLPFRPGLVGGHCIGVDPYYLTHKASKLGYEAQIILSGRKLNDSMSSYVADTMIQMFPMNLNKNAIKKILILGLTFKENCPDIRNSKVVDLIKAFPVCNFKVDIYDPWVDRIEAMTQYNIEPIFELKEAYYDGIILAVGHECFIGMGACEIKKKGKLDCLFFDLKSVFDRQHSHFRL